MGIVDTLDARKALEGKSIILVKNEKIMEGELRNAGVTSLEEVFYAAVKKNGKLYMRFK
ncbi:uncharacterized membrane protein YcaP (DUF421 family) [Evansella vedderi]|uniref:Uncharacterized membrane protein YcaP (DUF421 family) n=1 Tax=Evansella vedderi TaxID=38282 RepID=A0ABT9ZTU6_9BACI|nr:hypothetical protein [Evansella vedderi]MDQ0253585.1 uncharacterized membrane protein YcaP (DUF421 family) [Evansella vedderi]